MTDKREVWAELTPKLRLAFWKRVMLRPENRREYEWGKATGDELRFHDHDGLGFTVAMTIGADYVSVYIRDRDHKRPARARKRLMEHAAELEEMLGAPLLAEGDTEYFFRRKFPTDLRDEANWDEAGAFLIKAAAEADAALEALFKPRH
ncbi:hypothetical protein [Chthonobacter rhizosphaerae]|uniref:hypothetical protein n=1 Tax=Chthonobacter rhizosphaerae TaxID=2735553 RepID=UPI0015EF11D3|nr:hypothetical protein [Chthonobacter rhizosphaerae]